jgi:dTDP-4-amino-4,6-dideoxygalactose transaminase
MRQMIKHSAADLAVLGGPAAFTEALHVGRPNIGDPARIQAAVGEVLAGGILSNAGPRHEELEARLGDFLGAHCVLVANATLGLMLVARALDLHGEVIMPAFTFVATAHSMAWCGLTPVFCDIGPDCQIDPAQAESLVTPATSAILGVHLYGRACKIEGLQAIASRYGLRLFFDAAHAFACSHGGRPIGLFGDASVFSFHATKAFNTFEGGAILTRDAGLATVLRRMRNFGFSDYDTVDSTGINAKMNEVAAAMGLVSLDAYPGFVEAEERNFHAYQAAFEGLDGIHLLPIDEDERNNYHYVASFVDERRLGLSREELMKVLQAENALVRRYFYPGCHRLQPYASDPRWRDAKLPVTDDVAERVLCFPTGVAVGPQQIEAIAAIIEKASAAAVRVRDALAGQQR